MSKRRPTFAEEILLQMMADAGVADDAELAALVGISPRRFANIWSEGFPSWRTRARVEAALGFRAVWSKPQVVAARGRIYKRLGFDPAQLSMVRLQEEAVKIGISRIHNISQEELVAEFVAKFVITPS